IYYYPANKLQIHHGSAVLLGNYLNLGHGGGDNFPTCVEFVTGKMMWDKVRGPGSGSATIAYADGHLYFLYANGVVALVTAKPDKFELKGKFAFPGPKGECWAYPAISNGRLYVRNHDVLYCYNLKK